MKGNNKNISQWYLHTFGTSQKEKANKFIQCLQQNLKPGEKYVLLCQNGLYRFQVLTTFAQLGLGVQNIDIRKTGPNDKMFNQTRTLPCATVFEKSLQNQININPMMMKGNNFINPNNIFQGFNNQVPNKNAMMQGFNNQFCNPQLNNNSINQQKQALEALNPKNCDTQHIEQFFNEETILKKIKDCQTIHPVNNNVRQSYLNCLAIIYIECINL